MFRQFELQKPSGRALMTWLPAAETRAVGVGSVISLKDEPDERWTVIWRSAVLLPAKMLRRKRFTNSAVRDEDGHWST